MQLYDLDKNSIFLSSQYAVIVDENERVLMLQNNAKWDKQFGKWELPGGLIEFDEKLKDNLHREVKEETNLTISVTKIMSAGDNHIKGFLLKDGRRMDVRFINIAYLCHKIKGEVHLSEEHNNFIWAEKHQLSKLNISSSIKFAIDAYLKL